MIVAPHLPAVLAPREAGVGYSPLHAPAGSRRHPSLGAIPVSAAPSAPSPKPRAPGPKRVGAGGELPTATWKQARPALTSFSPPRLRLLHLPRLVLVPVPSCSCRIALRLPGWGRGQRGSRYRQRERAAPRTAGLRHVPPSRRGARFPAGGNRRASSYPSCSPGPFPLPTSIQAPTLPCLMQKKSTCQVCLAPSGLCRWCRGPFPGHRQQAHGPCRVHGNPRAARPGGPEAGSALSKPPQTDP